MKQEGCAQVNIDYESKSVPVFVYGSGDKWVVLMDDFVDKYPSIRTVSKETGSVTFTDVRRSLLRRWMSGLDE